MAEAAVRIAHLEEAVTKVKHDELLTQVFFRLNEMDDLLEATAHGASAHAELRTQSFSLMHQDKDLIRERVGRLHQHAQHLLHEMRTQMEAAKQTLNNATSQASALSAAAARAAGALHIPAAQEAHERATARLQEVDEHRKKTRIEAVESVLQYIDSRSHDAHAELTFDEYQIVLNALIDGTEPPPAPSHPPGVASIKVTPHDHEGVAYPHEEAMQTKTPALVMKEALTKDQADIAALQAAFERRAKGGVDYEAMAASDPRLHAAKQVASRREAARKEFEQRFFAVYDGGIGHTQPGIFSSTLSKALDSLPQHCLSTITALMSKMMSAKSM
ncbi:uncharacterized protein HaLaN_11894 [Haematococcus lacustris]|uniref:Uncharacterized protein n=1 Tax=Haematococcus lacustris TaxID=44745 RepID=A0A699Z8V6_HAELA|nr:uncharacterized protein HaLaN_11894 [Haematococcus lacustris]